MDFDRQSFLESNQVSSNVFHPANLQSGRQKLWQRLETLRFTTRLHYLYRIESRRLWRIDIQKKR